MIIWAIMYLFSDGVVVQTPEHFSTEEECKERIIELKQTNLRCDQLVLK